MVEEHRPGYLAYYRRSQGSEGVRGKKKAHTSSLEAEEALSLADQARRMEVGRWQASPVSPRQVTLCLVCKTAVILFLTL